MTANLQNKLWPWSHDNQIYRNFKQSPSSEVESTHGTKFNSFLPKDCWDSALLV